MKRYRVEISYDTDYFYVEAETEEDALHEARQMVNDKQQYLWKEFEYSAKGVEGEDDGE